MSERLPPSKIGKYRILGVLGKGGMGTVYRAQHELLGQLAAIKTLHPEVAARQSMVERFFREAQAATQINDPGIVRVYDYGMFEVAPGEQTGFIVLEYLDGEALSDRLTRIGKMAPADALRTTRLLSGSLAAAHAKHIIHRDLKPDNVFLVPDPAVAGGERPKLLDFGIAKLARDADEGVQLTKTGQVLGTPVYMSPEQWRGAGEVDGRADVYSLGCMLYQMLCGAPPFVGNSIAELCTGHVTDIPTLPSHRIPGISPEVDSLVMACLEKNRDQRIGSMVELSQRIASIEAGASLLSSPGMTVPAAPVAAVVGVGAATEPGAPTTTLSASSSQVMAPAAARRGKGVLLAVTALLLVAAGVVAAVLVGAFGAAVTPLGEALGQPADKGAQLAPATPVSSATAPVPDAAHAEVRIQLTSSPAGAAIYSADQLIGRTPFDGRLPVIAGNRVLVLRLVGRQDTIVTLPGERDASQQIALPVAPRGYGAPPAPAPAPPPPSHVPYDPSREDAD